MAKPIDLTGQRFCKLTVLRQSGKDKWGRIVWLCACDCGGKAEVQSGNLRSGNSKSCGCGKTLPNREDIAGQKFHLLTAIKVGREEHGKVWWDCACDCGNTTSVRAIKLKRGTTKSCGCYRKIAQRMGRPLSHNAWARDAKSINECCVNCGCVDDLHAHHVYGAAAFPALAADLANAAVLCGDCHREFHRTYGHNTHGPHELAEFLGIKPEQAEIVDCLIGWRDKGGVEDLKKARHYLDLLIEKEAGG